MRLVADRFAVHADGRAFDLATGARITLIVGSAGGVSEQLRWTTRCDALHGLRHHAMAPLIDYGLVGESSRFEAWGCGGPMRGRIDGEATHASATRWLRACGLSAGSRQPDSVRAFGRGGAVWLPDPGSGYPMARNDPAVSLPLRGRGLQIVEQPSVPILAEMFRSEGTRPRASVLWGAAGSGRRIVAGELARIARLKGFVPVAARLIASPQADLWKGRCLFVVASDEAVWPAFLRAALNDARPHVLLIIRESECRSIDGIGLGRLPAEALVSALRPQDLDEGLEQKVRTAADRAHGLAGRFVRLLWPAWDTGERSRLTLRRSRISRVAEPQVVYGDREQVDDLFAQASVASAWPAPGELAALRSRMETAVGQLAIGRQAPAIRQLRQVVGSFARRGAWADAVRASRELAAALVRRGQPREALTAVADGRDYAARARDESALIDLAIVGGHAWIDLGRLDEADSVLGAALTTARAQADLGRVAAASMAAARASYWRGDYAEAEALLRPTSSAPALQIRRALLAARVAIGMGQLSRAMARLADAAAPKVADDDVETKTAIAWTTALVHFAVGDLKAVECDLSETLTLARAGHNWQCVARARLLRIEVGRAKEGSTATLRALEQLRRLMTTAPAIVRTRWNLALALSSPGAVPAAAIAKHVRQTGLAALGLYVSDGSAARLLSAATSTAGIEPIARSGGTDAAPAFIDDLVAILRVCQTAADETALLRDVCARLRQHLHAAAVACTAVRGGSVRVLAFDGARVGTEIAERAVSAGIAVPPHRHDDRLEAAVPIAYGGAPIGALSARWTIGSMYDTSRAADVLTMSAAAAAPMVAAVIARQSIVESGAGELLGVAPATVALRESVAGAAAAPFGVLIDGESGSGKELVARAIHRGSARRHKAFCTLNCAALPDELVEAELFGHTRGAFTGAIAERAGVFEEAHGGTLFLDEVGELTPRAQAKVLRVIQEGELRRVGENVSRRVDVRIVSATNRALKHEVEAGRFRLDLLYRLDVVHISVPPLRERQEDVALLAEHFWRDATQRVGSRATLSAATVAALARYDWPGNIRELQNVLAALAVRTPKRGLVPPSALPACFADRPASEGWSLDEARRTFEVSFVRAALVRTGGHRGRAAAELGVTRQGLAKLMNRLGI